MALEIGNAPCSWGVEFANDDRNPDWRTVLAECAQAGYTGIELGPVGYMPEDPNVLGPALAELGLTLIGGVVFRPFHDEDAWDELQDAARRTCEALKAHGARHLVLIDSISPRRAATAGRPDEAEQMSAQEWAGFVERVRAIARLGTEDYGLITSLHPHAGGFIDFLPEVERMLAEIDPSILKLCVDTGHCTYAGFDPLAFIERHRDRLAYVHFKSTDAAVKAKAIANRTGFYDACGEGIFCKLAEGEIDFGAVRDLLGRIGYDGWCTVEQDCDPTIAASPLDDARQNREYLRSIGF
ncbi:TIM barrel protein [Rhodobacteraceae bacterium 2CG4]|uniref:TIM barrel protein n=1 Tax=Halovulum marinum TaxID=2662447 RepID=A0A6L5Z5G0_9RHOB|nr:TIM barrel protein [Halovulum marinum]MSU91274.1 TIM barrel protein [Halovulum marinum]